MSGESQANEKASKVLIWEVAPGLSPECAVLEEDTPSDMGH